jgi:hypothetical protein
MKQIFGFILFLGISVSALSQGASGDSILKPNVTFYTFQQTETVNIYFNNVGSKFIIENNTKQIHTFSIGIYDLAGNPILETRNECLIGKNIELPVDLNPGLYIVNVSDKTIVYTKKFLIR